VDVHHPFRDILAAALFARGAISGFLIGLSIRLLFLVCGVCRILLFGRRLFLTGDRLARSLTGARVGVCTLTAHRQVPTMAQSPVRTHVEMALNTRSNFASQITFDFDPLIHHLAQLNDIVIVQLVAF
jgi:hypothetical protein